MTLARALLDFAFFPIGLARVWLCDVKDLIIFVQVTLLFIETFKCLTEDSLLFLLTQKDGILDVLRID